MVERWEIANSITEFIWVKTVSKGAEKARKMSLLLNGIFKKCSYYWTEAVRLSAENSYYQLELFRLCFKAP